MSCAASLSCATARMAMPRRVREMSRCISTTARRTGAEQHQIVKSQRKLPVIHDQSGNRCGKGCGFEPLGKNRRMDSRSTVPSIMVASNVLRRGRPSADA